VTTRQAVNSRFGPDIVGLAAFLRGLAEADARRRYSIANGL
jgi:hypothetical protein